MTFRCPDKGRVLTGMFASEPGSPFGAFFLRSPDRRSSVPLKVIADDGISSGWEHVSVSLPHRTPTWAEMDFVKRQFWSDDDCVMQLHPPRAEWINNYPTCLHLWRPVDVAIPRPPSWTVGDAAWGTLSLETKL